MLGEDLRSQEVALQVPSALAGLTAGFEMGPGVPPPLDTPSKRCPRRVRHEDFELEKGHSQTKQQLEAGKADATGTR